MKGSWNEKESDILEDIKRGFENLRKFDQQPNNIIYIGKNLCEFIRKLYAKKEISNNSRGPDRN